MERYRPTGKQIIFAVVHPLFALLALSLLGTYALDTVKASRATNWPSVQASVISSQVVHGCGRGSSYYPKVRYAYAVDGIGYENDTIAFGMEECGSESEARTIADRYAAGKQVPIYINPSSPSDSAIVVGEPGGATEAALAYGSPILLFWLFLAWRSIRALRAPRGP